MGVDAASFRSVLGQWPSGVTVVTTSDSAGWHGMTASAFSSVSLEPPLVSICLHKEVWTHHRIEETGIFGITILGKDQADIGKRFAGMFGDDPTARFEGHPWATAVTGSPVLSTALGWLDCRVAYAYPGGDHTIYVGEVMAADTPRLTSPLLFHSRAWGQFADPLPEDAVLVDTTVVPSLRSRGVADTAIASIVSGLEAAGVSTRLDGPLGDVTGCSRRLVVTREQLDEAIAGQVRGIDLPLGSAALIPAARAGGLDVRVEIADAFDPARLHEVLASVTGLAEEASPDVIVLAEGSPATPLTVREVVQEVTARTRPVPLAVRLRADGLEQANLLTALKSGVRHVDVSLGGLGGVMSLDDSVRLLDALEVAHPVERSLSDLLSTQGVTP